MSSSKFANLIVLETIDIQGEDFKRVCDESETVLLYTFDNTNHQLITGDVIVFNISYPAIKSNYYKFACFVRMGVVNWIGSKAQGINIVTDDSKIYIYYTNLADFSKYHISGRVNSRIVDGDGLTQGEAARSTELILCQPSPSQTPSLPGPIV